ncbi:UNVERIFIED_CONTAM: hypothetical protein Sradi_3834400 [Sesamum radiatum]|uniref:Uncharacterized protein n=1 Tax=Sesamum radiatum TaxID=300843 RepID=A0AAW2Q128_SESRA
MALNVVLVPKPGEKWRMCIVFRDLNKACPRDYYSLPRIDQLVDSTSGCELPSMMDASQGTLDNALLEKTKKGQPHHLRRHILLRGHALQAKKRKNHLPKAGG